MKVVGLLLVMSGFVLMWGIGYRGLTWAQLQQDLGSWASGKGTVA